MRQTNPLRILESASILLFFLQALRAVISVMFGIIYDQVLAGPMDAWLGVSILLLTLALLLPALVPRNPGPAWLVVFASIASAARVGLSINQAEVRYWTSLIVLAAGGMYLAVLLVISRKATQTGIVSALVVDQLLRAAGHTYDLSLREGWIPIQAAWAVVLVLLSIRLGQRDFGIRKAYGMPGFSWGLAVGGMLFLETSLLTLPNSMARWSSWSYEVIAPLLLAFTWFALLPFVQSSVLEVFLPRRSTRAVLSVLLSLSLLVGYFASGSISALALLVAQAITLIGLICLLNASGERQPAPGSRLALGLFFLLVLNFFNAFAFTYPYTLPFMRTMGWAVYMAAALAFGLGMSTLRPHRRFSFELGVSGVWAWVVGTGALIILIVSVWPRPASPMPDTGSLRIATYNIHYGYNQAWRFTLEEIARTIEESGADIVALQEVDTGRLTSYAVDDAYYLARRLRMNAVYLPTVEHLTGIALLHYGTAELGDHQLLTSFQEQTGLVHAQLKFGDSQMDSYGVWLGLSNEDTQRQIRETLDFIGDRSLVVLGGDFNAEPGSQVVQAVEAAGFIDPFAALGIQPPPLTAPAIDPTSRIDYVWLRGLRPLQAWVSDSLASDHRMVVVEIAFLAK